MNILIFGALSISLVAAGDSVPADKATGADTLPTPTPTPT